MVVACARRAARYSCARVMLVGREEECAVLNGLLEDARRGRSARLAVLGEPGVGKTALVEHACMLAGDMKVLRFTG